MPTLTITKLYADNTVLTEAQLDAIKSSVEDFFNSTKIDSDNIQDLGITLAKLATAVQEQLNPTGTVLSYAGATAPSGYLLCDGSAVSQTTYAALFAVIGLTYGNPGGGNFNLPDLRGRVPIGKDDMGGSAANRVTSGGAAGIDGTVLGDSGGVEEHALVEAELAAHTHGATGLSTGNDTPNHYHQSLYDDSASGASSPPTATDSAYRRKDWASDFSYDLNSDGAIANVSRTSNPNTNHTHPISGNTASVGSDNAHTNMQPGLILNYIIKT